MPSLPTPVPQTAATPGLDTFNSIYREVQLQCPLAGAMLARKWVRNAFRNLVERRRWSWLVKRGQFIIYPLYNTGTITVNSGENVVVGAGTAWTSAMVGRQFRVGGSYPIYTIADIDVANQTLILDDIWGSDSFAATSYSIWNAYVTPPSDFHTFVSVWDASFNWQLWLNVKQDEINAWDAQRSNNGTPWAVVSYGYDNSNPPLPRYELWPHQFSQKSYPFLYESRPPDLDMPGATLPRFVPGSVLHKYALAEAAKWPGPSREQPNPYFNLSLARMLMAEWETEVMRLELQDDEVYSQDVSYSYPMAFAAFGLGDSRWMQSHGI